MRELSGNCESAVQWGQYLWLCGWAMLLPMGCGVEEVDEPPSASPSPWVTQSPTSPPKNGGEATEPVEESPTPASFPTPLETPVPTRTESPGTTESPPPKESPTPMETPDPTAGQTLETPTPEEGSATPRMDSPTDPPPTPIWTPGPRTPAEETPTLEPIEPTPPVAEPEEVTSVLIIGAGPAGLAAAYEAEARGLAYLIVDKAGEPGGTLRYLSRSPTFLFSGSPAQVQAGVEDSPGQLLNEWEALTGGDPSLPWVQAWAYGAVSEVYDFMVDLGLTFQLQGSNTDAGERRRLHEANLDGPGLTETLLAPLNGDAFRPGQLFTGLVAGDGGVIGAYVEDLDTGFSGWIEASAVVVATGGFLRDLEWVRWARPELEAVELWFSHAPEGLGEGLTAVRAVGANLINLEAIGVYAHGGDDYRLPGQGEELLVQGLQLTLWLNADGQRFYDESATFSLMAGETLLEQPEGLAWAIYDTDVHGLIQLTDPIVGDCEHTQLPDRAEAFRVSSNYVEDESLDALATAIGLDPQAVQDSVDTYNLGVDCCDEMGKDSTYVEPITTGPFYAIRVVPALAKGYGGLEVTLEGQVVDELGDPIPGLYAAGELTGMAGGSLVGDRGFGGSISSVVYSGRIAGRYASMAAE